MRIAVIAGGRTPERDVSLRSGQRVSHALVEGGHDAWLVDPGEVPLVEALHERAPDICYLTLHGKEGEDGTVQRLLDLLQIPYTGTAPFDCEVAFDKVLAKDALVRAGVDDARLGRRRRVGAARPGRRSRVVAGHGPCRPPVRGETLPVRIRARGELRRASIRPGHGGDGGAVVRRRRDRGSQGRGFGARRRGGRARPRRRSRWSRSCPRAGCSTTPPATRPEPPSTSRPARVPAEIATACTEQALRAVEGLHLRDVARVDTIVDASGTPWVLEVNVSPGMTETSLLPMAAQAAGWSLTELCERVLRSATRAERLTAAMTAH